MASDFKLPNATSDALTRALKDDGKVSRLSYSREGVIASKRSEVDQIAEGFARDLENCRSEDEVHQVLNQTLRAFGDHSKSFPWNISGAGDEDSTQQNATERIKFTDEEKVVVKPRPEKGGWNSPGEHMRAKLQELVATSGPQPQQGWSSAWDALRTRATEALESAGVAVGLLDTGRDELIKRLQAAAKTRLGELAKPSAGSFCSDLFEGSASGQEFTPQQQKDLCREIVGTAILAEAFEKSSKK